MYFGEVAGVATDSKDRVYVFSRSEHPITVFDRDGRFLTSWGEGVFTRAHGITIGPDDAVWYTTADGFSLEALIDRCYLLRDELADAEASPEAEQKPEASVQQARLAVRISGSWIAAVGMLMFGWSMRGY